MARFDELTNDEYTRLAILGKQFKQYRALTDQDIYWAFVNRRGIGSIHATIPEDIGPKADEADDTFDEGVEANGINIKRWAETGYISLFPAKDQDYIQFILTPRGLAYLSYREQWPPIRGLIDLWSDLRTEVVSAIVSAITSIVVSLITAYLILRLGLK
jgi:hypothetical protein